MGEENAVANERLRTVFPLTPEKFIDLEGQRFGAWKVLGYSGESRWLCYCQCGTVAKVPGQELQNGHSESCGCSTKQNENTRVSLSERDVLNIRRLYEDHYSQRFLARLYGVTQSSINDVIKRRTWKHI